MKTRTAHCLQTLFLACLFAVYGCQSTAGVEDTTDLANLDANDSPRSRDVAEDDPIVDLDAAIPVDSAVTIGKLANGLTYYIRNNQRPADRAELRLVVDAGSILETNAQLGLAHFVEHMAFNGTERFRKQELVEYLESTGVRFGADLNAYTSFDETVYMLQVPTDSLELLDTGIQILREWSSRILFDSVEVEKERGVVIEEWRLGRGANARIRDKELPVMLAGSRYPDRLPIGTKENLESFDPELLRQFYRDWYRPDLMAVVVVGDVDVNHIESMIRSEFGSLQQNAGAPQRTVYPIPDHEETLVSIVSDPEASVKSISVLYKSDDPHAGRDNQVNRVIRDGFVERLYSAMLNSRLNELTQSDSPPFFGAGAGFGTFGRTKKLYNISAIPGAAGYAFALETVLLEIERVRTFGFEASELDRAKTNLVRGYERAFAERDKMESRRYASEYVNNFLAGEAIPGIRFEYQLAVELVPGISLSEVNSVAARSVPSENRVLLVSGPEVDGEPLPTAEELLPILDKVGQIDLTRYVDAVASGELIESIANAGTIAEETYDAAADLHHLTLSNGAEVFYKKTDFKNDQVLFAASSPGGTSLVSDDLDVPADFASTLVTQSGVGRFGPIELQKKLAGKAVQVVPSITERREAIGGSSSPDDIETMLQLVHLYFTSPRVDSVAFTSFVARYRSLLENLNVDPNRVFFDTLSVTLAQNHPRRQPLTIRTLDQLDLQQSFAIYKERFADASDFTFYFVGSFEPDTLRPLIEKYLASLPSVNREEKPRDLGVRPPTGFVEKVIRRGSEPKSRVQLVLTGPAEYSQTNRRKMRVVQGLLDIKLREVLREDLGGTYGVSVSGSIVKEPVQQFQFSLGFGCAPDRVDELVQTALDELARFVAEGPDLDDLQKVVEKTQRQHEVGLRQNGYWLSSIQYYNEQGLPFGDIKSGGRSFYDTIVPEEIREAAIAFLDQTNLVKVVLDPSE